MGVLDDVTWKHVNDILKLLNYDTESLTITSDTGIVGVKVNIGQEEMYLVCNNSGVQIDNGKVVYASGVDFINNCLEIGLADNASFQTSAQILGLATHDIGDGELGLVTKRGLVRDFDTTLLTSGLIWLGTSGNMTTDTPLFPAQRISMGASTKLDAINGVFQVVINRVSRNDVNKSYSFTSTGILSGTYSKAGFYDFSATSVTLTQASTTQTHGVANLARDAHAGIVSQAVGTVVGGGQVGLRIINSIEDFEDGSPQLAAQSGIITEDITTLTPDTYFETIEKWSGIITFELYVVSGAPTSYSLTMNYGFAKYEDFRDRDITIQEFECVWQGNANSTLDITLIKHTSSGWTYAATGFIAGNGDICRKSVDQQLAGDVGNGLDGSYKRLDLNEYISGKELDQGVIIEITTGANSTIQTMDMHITGVSEELDF